MKITKLIEFDKTLFKIADNEPPVLECTNKTVNTDDGVSTATGVTINATVTDNVDSNLMATCTATDAITFDHGSTEVSCSATDSSQNMGNCTFNVTVEGNYVTWQYSNSY